MVQDEYRRQPSLLPRCAALNLVGFFIGGKNWIATLLNAFVQIPYLLIACLGVRVAAARRAGPGLWLVVAFAVYYVGIHLPFLAIRPLFRAAHTVALCAGRDRPRCMARSRRAAVILVTGGTGAMGARLVRGLVERGEEVRVLTLPNDPLVSRLANLSCDIRFGDVADARSLEGVLDDIETVFHLAAILLSREPEVFRRVNVEGTRNTLNAAMAASAVHFVFVSSISVTYDWPTPYSLSKRESERIVKAQTRVPWTIVRPTLAYDVGGGEEFMMFMNALMRYPIVPFIGRGSALKSPVYVEDIVRGFLAIPRQYKKPRQDLQLLRR